MNFISAAAKEQIIVKKIFDLGFEVGLKNHSEIGWVLREFNVLMRDAQHLGIKSPESYYNDGKLKGKASRDRGLEGPKVHEKETKGINKVELIITSSDINNITEEIESHHLLREPSFNELPPLVKKSKVTKIPELLEGFRLLKRK
jgi:hypothetical protein